MERQLPGISSGYDVQTSTPKAKRPPQHGATTSTPKSSRQRRGYHHETPNNFPKETTSPSVNAGKGYEPNANGQYYVKNVPSQPNSTHFQSAKVHVTESQRRSHTQSDSNCDVPWGDRNCPRNQRVNAFVSPRLSRKLTSDSYNTHAPPDYQQTQNTDQYSNNHCTGVIEHENSDLYTRYRGNRHFPEGDAFTVDLSLNDGKLTRKNSTNRHVVTGCGNGYRGNREMADSGDFICSSLGNSDVLRVRDSGGSGSAEYDAEVVGSSRSKDGQFQEQTRPILQHVQQVDASMTEEEVSVSRQILKIAKIQRRLLDINREIDSITSEENMPANDLSWDVSKITEARCEHSKSFAENYPEKPTQDSTAGSVAKHFRHKPTQDFQTKSVAENFQCKIRDSGNVPDNFQCGPMPNSRSVAHCLPDKQVPASKSCMENFRSKGVAENLRHQTVDKNGSVIIDGGILSTAKSTSWTFSGRKSPIKRKIDSVKFELDSLHDDLDSDRAPSSCRSDLKHPDESSTKSGVAPTPSPSEKCSVSSSCLSGEVSRNQVPGVADVDNEISETATTQTCSQTKCQIEKETGLRAGEQSLCQDNSGLPLMFEESTTSPRSRSCLLQGHGLNLERPRYRSAPPSLYGGLNSAKTDVASSCFVPRLNSGPLNSKVKQYDLKPAFEHVTASDKFTLSCTSFEPAGSLCKNSSKDILPHNVVANSTASGDCRAENIRPELDSIGSQSQDSRVRHGVTKEIRNYSKNSPDRPDSKSIASSVPEFVHRNAGGMSRTESSRQSLCNLSKGHALGLKIEKIQSPIPVAYSDPGLRYAHHGVLDSNLGKSKRDYSSHDTSLIPHKEPVFTSSSCSESSSGTRNGTNSDELHSADKAEVCQSAAEMCRTGNNSKLDNQSLIQTRNYTCQDISPAQPKSDSRPENLSWTQTRNGTFRDHLRLAQTQDASLEKINSAQIRNSSGSVTHSPMVNSLNGASPGEFLRHSSLPDSMTCSDPCDCSKPASSSHASTRNESSLSSHFGIIEGKTCKSSTLSLSKFESSDRLPKQTNVDITNRTSKFLQVHIHGNLHKTHSSETGEVSKMIGKGDFQSNVGSDTFHKNCKGISTRGEVDCNDSALTSLGQNEKRLPFKSDSPFSDAPTQDLASVHKGLRRKLAYTPRRDSVADSAVESLLDRSEELRCLLRISTNSPEDYESVSPTVSVQERLFEIEDFEQHQSVRMRHFRVENSSSTSSGGPGSHISSRNRTFTGQYSTSSSSSYTSSEYLPLPVPRKGGTHLNRTPSPGCDVCSNGTKTIRLIELLYGKDRSSLQEFILKARWFTAWRANVKRTKKHRKHLKVSLERADNFCRRIFLTKCFSQWQTQCNWKERRAVSMYESRTLRKGLNGFKWAVQCTSSSQEIVEKRVEKLELTRMFSKWRTQSEARQYDYKQRAFTKWRVSVIECKRLRQMESRATHHLLSKSYYQWKLAMFQVQSNGIADLHYRLTVLNKFFETWRLQASEGALRRKRLELAVIHHEQALYRKVFYQMRVSYTQSCLAKSHHRRNVLSITLSSWHQAVRLARIEKLSDVRAAREMHRHHLLSRSLRQWQERFHSRRAETFHKHVIKRKVFTTWQRRLCEERSLGIRNEELADRHVLRGAFLSLRMAVQRQKLSEADATDVLKKFALRRTFHQWSKYASQNARMRNKMKMLKASSCARTMRQVINHWQCRLREKLMQKAARKIWSENCARLAVLKWTNLVRTKRLEKRLTETEPERDVGYLKVYFTKWQNAKLRMEQLEQQAEGVCHRRKRNTVRQMFMTWRIRVMEARLIRPVKERRQRKGLARCFDAWREVIVRKKKQLAFSAQVNCRRLRTAFQIWRAQHDEEKRCLEAREKVLQGVKRRVFSALLEVTRRERASLVYCNRRVLHNAFITWRDTLEESIERRAIESRNASERLALLQKYFGDWRKQTTLRMTESDQILQSFWGQRERVTQQRCFLMWRHVLEAERKARAYREALETKQLCKCLLSWRDYSQKSMEIAVQKFNLRLDGVLQQNSVCQTTYLTPTSSGFHGSISNLDWRRNPLDCGDVPEMTTPSLPQSMFCTTKILVHRASPDEGLETTTGYMNDSDSSEEFVTPDGSPLKPEDVFIVRSLPEERHDTVQKINSYRRALSTEHANMNYEMKRIRASSCTRSLFADEERNLVQEETRVKKQNLRHLTCRLLTRWLQWPMSGAFTQWKEYVQRQKVERAKVMQVKERSDDLLLKRMFDAWKRRAVLLRKAEENRVAGVKQQAFHQLVMYTHVQKKQAKMGQIAEEYHTSSVVCRTFAHWKDQAQVRLRWEEMLSFNVDNTSAVRVADAFHQTILTSCVRQCFKLWRERLRRVAIVKDYHKKEILKRCFTGWLVWTKERRDRRSKAQNFLERQLIKKAFVAWKIRFLLLQEVEHRYYMCQEERQHDVIIRWHLWTQETLARREVGLQIQKRFALRKKARAFWLWKHTYIHRRKIEEVFQNNLLRRCFRSWRDYIHRKKDLLLKLDVFAQRRQHHNLFQMFRGWRDRRLTATEMRRQEERRRQHLMEKYAARWKHRVMETRAIVFHETTLIRRTFDTWLLETRRQLRLGDIIRGAVAKWRQRVEMNRALYQASEELLEVYEMKTVTSVFSVWVEEYRSRVVAGNYYENTLQLRIFRGWLKHHRRMKVLKQRSEELILWHQRKKIAKVFLKWKQRYDVICTQHQLLECHLEAKEVDTKRTIFLTWVMRAKEIKAERHWERTTLRKVLQAWSHWIKGNRERQSIGEDLMRSNSRRLQIVHFQTWRRTLKQSQDAREHYRNSLKRRVLHNLRIHISRKKELGALKMMAQGRRNERLLVAFWSEWLTHWRRHVDLRERQDRLQDRLSLRRQESVFLVWKEKTREVVTTKTYWKNKLKKCFHAWRQFAITRKQEAFMEAQRKKRQHGLAVKYCGIWRNSVEVLRFVQERAVRTRLTKTWMQWRRAVIQKRESLHFLEMDRAQLLREVFQAWRQQASSRKEKILASTSMTSGAILEDADTQSAWSEIDTTLSSYRSSSLGFFSESDSEMHTMSPLSYSVVKS